MSLEPAAMTRSCDPGRAEDAWLQHQTRRHFFETCGVGLGAMALGSLLRGRAAAAPGARPGHLPAKARSVIYLFMAGGPSQLELFDYKPELV
jgi:hypothetical protein